MLTPERMKQVEAWFPEGVIVCAIDGNELIAYSWNPSESLALQILQDIIYGIKNKRLKLQIVEANDAN